MPRKKMVFMLEILLESLLVVERGEFLRELEGRNKGNGYRLGHTSGHFGDIEKCLSQ